MEEIKIKLSFKARLELFCLSVKLNWDWNYALHGFKGALKGLIKDLKDLFKPKEMGCLFG